MINSNVKIILCKYFLTNVPVKQNIKYFQTNISIIYKILMNLLKRFPGIALLIKICNSITSLVHRNTEEGKSCEGLPILVAGPLDLKSPLSYRQKTCQPSGSFVEM